MNLIETLRNKIEGLDDGEYMHGLRAVLLHIETAGRHLYRGQETDDETAFTDAIYRTNQAFEGSIKEAYRVLADKNPENERPYDIELYLENNSVFRSRVLNQLTIYRKEWRNPSTHDYKLDFDESESLLAIVSVSAFSCLLLDQIAEKLSFGKAQAETIARKGSVSDASTKQGSKVLLERVLDHVSAFCEEAHVASHRSSKIAGVQAVGALHGFLATVAPDLTIETEKQLDSKFRYRADMVVSKGAETIVIEIRLRLKADRFINAAVRVEDFLNAAGLTQGVIVALPDEPSEMDRLNAQTNIPGGEVVALVPTGSNKALQGTLRFAPRP